MGKHAPYEELPQDLSIIDGLPDCVAVCAVPPNANQTTKMERLVAVNTRRIFAVYSEFRVVAVTNGENLFHSSAPRKPDESNEVLRQLTPLSPRRIIPVARRLVVLPEVLLLVLEVV